MKGVSGFTATIIIIGVSLTIAVLVGLWMSGFVPTTTSYEKLEAMSSYVQKTHIHHKYEGVDPNFPQHVCVVKRVIDGYRFVCSPFYMDSNILSHKFKLDDVKPANDEAYSALKQLIEGKIIFLDIDDVKPVDKYNNVYVVAYVRYNETHLLNVNKYLLMNGYLKTYDQPNEFSPSNWSLFIYYPEKYYDVSRSDLFVLNVGAKIYKYAYGISYTVIDNDKLAFTFSDKEKSYLRVFIYEKPSKIITAGKPPSETYEKVYIGMTKIANNGTHILVAWTTGKGGKYAGYYKPIIYRIYSLSDPENYKEDTINRSYAFSPSVLYENNKWIIVYGVSKQETINDKTTYYYNIVVRMINPVNLDDYEEYEYSITTYTGSDPAEANKVGYNYVQDPIIYNNALYLTIRYYDKETGYNIGLLKFNLNNHGFSIIPVDEFPGDQGTEPDTYSTFASCFNIYNNTFTSNIVKNKLLILYTNYTDGRYGYSKLYYAVLDINTNKILKRGVIAEVGKVKHRFYPRISNSEKYWLISWRDNKRYYHLTFINIDSLNIVKNYTFVYSYVNRVKSLYISSDKLFIVTFNVAVKNETNNKYYENIYLATIDEEKLSYNNGLSGIVLANTDDEYNYPAYMGNGFLADINTRVEYDSSGQRIGEYVRLTTLKPYVRIPPKLSELIKSLSNAYEIVVIIRNTGTTESSIREILLDGKSYESYGRKVILETPLPIRIPSGRQVEIKIIVKMEPPFVPGKTLSIEFISSRGSKVYKVINLP